MDKDELKKELRIYKHRLEDAMDAGDLAWWEMELPSGEINTNPRKAEMLGYSPENFDHYEDFTELIHPDDYEDTMQAMRNHIEGRKDKYEAEYRIKKKNDEYTWFRDIGGITEKDGEYKKVTGIVIDITERKETENRKELLNQLLRHDLRNKIQTNQGYLQLLKEEDLNPEINQTIETVLNSIKQSLDLINKVSTLTKLEKETMKKIELCKLIEDIKTELKSKLSDKNIELKIEVPEEKCQIIGGPLLKDAVSNIVENTIQHSNAKKIKMTQKTEKNKIICIIEDDGKGIPDDKKEKIFDKGYTTDKERGTGLGLYLVKMILKKYRGNIEVKDSELGGARFDIHLQKTDNSESNSNLNI